MSIPTLITFIAYFVLVMVIGVYFWFRSRSIEDYLLGGRGMGAWVTALSAQASDMSGWLLMALPGAIYWYGLGRVWMPVGLFIGTVLNWLLVAPRLREYTRRTNTITLPCFFEERFGDLTGLLRIISAIVILLFFTIYASSGLRAAGELFESAFDVPYHAAVIIGGVIIIAYTFLGGFMAVCWTDLFQGALMVLALVVVPIAAYRNVGGIETIREAMTRAAQGREEMSVGLIPAGTLPALAMISAGAWGLGYFGQPHILARFMSAKSQVKLSQSMVIAIIWVFVSLGGAVIVGLIGIGMFETYPSQEEAEKVFIDMIGKVMHPWLCGVMLAAILSAIMSTIDSQLLVSSSALTEDFYQKAINKQASERRVVWVGRLCVIVISAIALALALPRSETILRIVAYAWAGLGAAFGPLVLFALFSRKTAWQGALAGMVVGTVVLIVWKQVGLGQYLYEIVPGFVANCVVMACVNRAAPQRNGRVLKLYDEATAAVRARRRHQEDG